MKKAIVLLVVQRQKVMDSSRLAEDVALSVNVGLTVVVQEICLLRRTPHPKTYIGKGWVEKVHQYVQMHEVQVVAMDPEISPIQQRNLEKAWGCQVLGRTAVILEIFGQRARTSAGTLQVQLATLLYQRGRLVRHWTHLERQRGGFGFLAGPGESQLELDRRLLQEKITRIEGRLETVSKTRHLHRKARQRVPYPVVALLGYTNTGKSTLFNQLTEASVSVQDRPFETLDPTMRQLVLPSKRTVILSDTVGFISDLPESLKKAFEATLEEIKQADLLLHVQDASCPWVKERRQDVLDVLSSMGCDKPMIDVFNKIDLVHTESPLEGIAVSALKHQGLGTLLSRIDDFLDQDTVCFQITWPQEQGACLPWLYANGHVLSSLENTAVVRLSEERLQRFQSAFPKSHYKRATT